MSKSLAWYRWQPGALPQIERVSPAVRGLAWAIMDTYWQNEDAASTAEEMLADLMLPHSQNDLESLEMLMPVLLNYIDKERQTAESYRDKKREAGRLGGLARSSTAKQCLAEPSSAKQTVAPTYLPTEQPEYNPPLPPQGEPQLVPPRRERIQKQKDPLEGQGLVAIVWELHPDRTNQDGKRIAIGARLPTMRKLTEKVKAHGLTESDIRDIQTVYKNHPNVQNGYVQATEVFWGDNGRWFDCWQIVQQRREKLNQKEQTA